MLRWKEMHARSLLNLRVQWSHQPDYSLGPGGENGKQSSWGLVYMVCNGLNFIPHKIYVKLLTSRISECYLIWKWGHCRCDYLKWDCTGVGWASNPIWVVSLWRRQPCEDTGTPGEGYVKMEADSEAFTGWGTAPEATRNWRKQEWIVS